MSNEGSGLSEEGFSFPQHLFLITLCGNLKLTADGYLVLWLKSRSVG